jgi:hypothetical protein
MTQERMTAGLVDEDLPRADPVFAIISDDGGARRCDEEQFVS